MGRNGFEIYKTFYPMPERFRLSDPVLVREVTGMEWPDFVDARDRMLDEAVIDEVVVFGLAAVAFWQGNPEWSREKIRNTLEKVWQEDVEVIVEDDAPAELEGDAGPPAGDGVTPSETPRSSNGSADAASDATSPKPSGSPGSIIGSPA